MKNTIILFILLFCAIGCDKGGDDNFFVSSPSPVVVVDVIPPTVIATNPPTDATNIPVNTGIVATFSEPIDPSTVNAATFTVFDGVANIIGNISSNENTASFIPTTDLLPSTLYTVTLSTGIEDIAGNSMVASYIWSFTTGIIPDPGLPTVIENFPLNAATNVPINTPIFARFNEEMNSITITTTSFTVSDGANVTGTVTYTGTTATFTTTGDLLPNTLYTATITTDAEDLAGNALAADYSWVFTTGVNRIIYVAPPPTGDNGSSGEIDGPVATIQEAINRAVDGDIIQLAPGLYSVSARIDINKSVTILGPQAGVDPRNNAGTTRIVGSANEAVVQGSGISTIFRILDDNVVIDGLEVFNGSGDLIDSQTGTPTNGTIIRNLIVHGATGDEGIQLRALTNGIIEYNHVFTTAGDGINVCCSSTNTVIRFNEIHDINSGDGAVYVYNSTSVTVESNEIYDVNNNDAIKMGIQGGGDAAVVSNHNVLNNLIYNIAEDAIAIYTSNVLVDGNEVYDCFSTNAAVRTTYSTNLVTFSNNNIYDNFTVGIGVGGTGSPTNTVVTGNRIENNSGGGLNNLSPQLVDAEDNWWGDASGPSGSGPGTGDSVSAQVDFDPWLTTSPF